MDGTTGVSQLIAGGRLTPPAEHQTTSRQVPPNQLGVAGTVESNPISGPQVVSSTSRSTEVTSGLNSASVTGGSNGDSVD